MEEQKIKDKLKKGWIHVLVTFEVMGKPKEHVEKSLTEFIGGLKKEERITFINEHHEKAEKRDNDFFSAFAEIDILVQDFETLTWIAVNFTPASIEIIEPNEFKLSSLDLQNHFNDLISRLHLIGNTFKTQSSQLEFLKVNFARLVQNLLVLSLAKGPKKPAQLAKETTLKEELVKEQLANLIKKKTVTEKKGVYSLER